MGLDSARKQLRIQARHGGKAFWQFAYDSLAAIRKDDWFFMNYGYAPVSGDAGTLQLGNSEEDDRYSIQMYHHVATSISIQDQDVLEVGCGRGGGAAYMATRLGPRSVTGVDLSEHAVEFCRRVHKVPGLRFDSGDAENLPFPDASFDAIINIESCHCYEDVQRFMTEAWRVLKKSGVVSMSDVVHRKSYLDTIKEAAVGAQFTIVSDTDISANVARALDLASPSKERRIDEQLGAIEGASMALTKSLKDFAGIKDGRTYRAIRDGKYRYFHWVLQKK